MITFSAFHVVSTVSVISLGFQSYPVCQGAPPAPEPSRLYEAPDHKHSRNHHTLLDRETDSLAPGYNS